MVIMMLASLMQSATATPVRALEPTIDGDEGFVVLVRSPIEPEEAEGHVVRVTRAIEGYISSLPGYISGNLHVRLDKHEFLNYTEWTTERDYDAFIASLEEERGQEVVKNVSYAPTLIRYQYHETLLPETNPITESYMGFTAVVRTEIGSGDIKQAYKKIRQDIIDDVRNWSGFISASLHIKQGGKEVMNYTEWESEAHFDTFINSLELQDKAIQTVDKFIRVKTFRALGS
jgi:heme-degrading monooxygenase HmoA